MNRAALILITSIMLALSSTAGIVIAATAAERSQGPALRCHVSYIPSIEYISVWCRWRHE